MSTLYLDESIRGFLFTINAAKHYQTTLIEDYLQKTPRVVIEYALRPPHKVPSNSLSTFEGNYDDYYATMIRPLERLIETIRKIQPKPKMVVVCASMNDNDSSSNNNSGASTTVCYGLM